MVKILDWLKNRYEDLGASIRAPMDNAVEFMEERLSSKISEGLINTIETIEPELMPSMIKMLDNMEKAGTLPTEIQPLADIIRGDQKPVQLVAAAALLIPLAFLAIGPVLSGPMEHIKQGSMRYALPSLMSIDELITADWRDFVDEKFIVSEHEQMGLTAGRYDTMKKVRRYYPGPQDFIRFTVRDVFRSDIVKEYGYDQDWDKISSQLAPHLKKIGMDPEIMKWYWLAHWDLPSPQMAFEMLHRGMIKEDDVRQILKISDMAPSFIDPIIGISYSPYTRVDVRRMYQAGILDYDQVVKSYQDIGYDQEHAETMADWTASLSVEKERDLTKSEILKALSVGAASDTDTAALLKDMGYDEEEAALIIYLQMYKDEKKYVDSEKKVLSKQYLDGVLQLPEYKKALGALKLSQREIEITIKTTELKRKAKHKDPSKDDLNRWAKAGIISKSEYTEMMQVLGYSMDNIARYIEEMG